MKEVVSALAAFLAMLVPASAAPLVPNLRALRDRLQFVADAFN